jgi:hypothetical protein
MTDFIVFSFVTIIVFILLSAAATLVILALFRPEADNARLVTILADVTTSLISALVGFLAGKGQGRSDAEEAQKTHEIEVLKATHPEPAAPRPAPATRDGDV